MYVYILRSQKDSQRFYVGITNNLDRRISEHNNPEEKSWIKRFSPWELKTYIVFQDEPVARSFEIYLKSHSGRAFLKKHLI